MRALLLIGLLLVTGCGRKHWEGGDPALFGMVLEVRPDAEKWFAAQDHGRDRVALVLRETARFFGHPTSEFDGVKLVIQAGLTSCGGNDFIGCENTRESTLSVRTMDFTCIEELSIQHEVLHLFIEDHDHLSPLWAKVEELREESMRPCH